MLILEGNMFRLGQSFSFQQDSKSKTKARAKME